MNKFIPMDVEGKFWLINILTQETVAIAFIKKDGTERRMRCTLNMEFIPKDKHPKSESSTDLSAAKWITPSNEYLANNDSSADFSRISQFSNISIFENFCRAES